MTDLLPRSFPLAIDSTMMGTYRECPTHFFHSYVLRRRPKGESIHLVAGGAFAAGIEAARRAWYEHGIRDKDTVLWLGLQAVAKHHTLEDEAIAERHRAKNRVRVLEALALYLDRWPFDSDILQPIRFAGGRYGIEFTFALPLPIAHPDTGDPLLYAGRCDMLATYGERGYFGVDEKTSGSLGPQWANAFRLRAQFLGYAWAARESGTPLNGFMVRGIGFLSAETKFDDALIWTPEYKIDSWYRELLVWAQRAVDDYRAGTYLHAYGSPCSSYGGCPFTDVCDNPPDVRMRLLAQDFEHNGWSPVAPEPSLVKINT